jgi:hypothetical protein
MLLSNSTLNGVLQLAIIKDSLFNNETRRRAWARIIMLILLSQRTGRGVGVEILKGAVNSKAHHRQKEKLSVSTATKRVI